MQTPSNPQATATARQVIVPARCRSVIPKAKVNALIAASAELSSDAIQHTSNRRSKIYVNLGYLWTGRGPEINNELVPVRRPHRSVLVGREKASAAHVRKVVDEDRGITAMSEISRRRARQSQPRPRVIQFSVTEEEFQEVSSAAGRSGLARGAYAAVATLAVARGAEPGMPSPLREALVELMTAAGLVRRAGTNLVQAVTRLNATGQRGEDLLPAARFCMRVIRRLDEVAEQLRRRIP